MVGIGQKSLGANLFHRLWEHGLHRGLSSDGDEGGSVDVAVRRPDDGRSSESSRKLRFDAERGLRHEVYSISSG